MIKMREYNSEDNMDGVNPNGQLPNMFSNYARRQVERERRSLLQDKELNEKNMILDTLLELKHINIILIKQNKEIIRHLSKISSGPEGNVHFMYFRNYEPRGSPNYSKIFIDFIRGDKDRRSIIPAHMENDITYPYSKVFMLKITNDGPADIEFRTNRHTKMIVLKSGESEPVNENEKFPITELHINNLSSTEMTSIRVIVYA